RDALSVRQRMGELLGRLGDGAFHRFETLFEASEGRLGVVVTFLGLLTLAKEQLVDIVQEAPLAPIYVKSLAIGTDPEEIQLSSEFDDAANDDATACRHRTEPHNDTLHGPDPDQTNHRGRIAGVQPAADTGPAR